jgi:hypothetical protein
MRGTFNGWSERLSAAGGTAWLGVLGVEVVHGDDVRIQSASQPVSQLAN